MLLCYPTCYRSDRRAVPIGYTVAAGNVPGNTDYLSEDTVDRRYTDYDVRSNPDLRELAHRYLRQYNGNFQFLNEARNMLLRGEQMHYATIRGVLNSMLADPTVVNMPEPVLNPFNAGGPFDPPKGLDLNFHPGPPVLRRPTTIKVPARWRFLYGISNHTQALAVHVVDPERSHGILHVTPWEVNYKLFWLCAGYSLPQPYHEKLALFGLDDAILLIQTGEAAHIKHLTKGETKRPWKWCRTCVKISHR